MGFPVIPLAVGALATVAAKPLMYGSGAHLFSSADPAGEDAATTAALKKTITKVYDQLKASGWRYSINNYITGGACVQATADRGKYLQSFLPTTWTILSCTVDAPRPFKDHGETGSHTFNVVRCDDPKNQKTHYWIADTYVILYVQYLGSSLPSDMFITPQTSELKGTAK
jgi:hypothetical protein